MVDSSEDEGFENYIPDTIDPGPYALIITLIFCIVLIAFLPCFTAIGNRFKWPKRSKALHATDENDSDSANGRHEVNTTSLNRNKHVKDDDEESVNSAHSKMSAISGISSVANSMLNVILDSSPRSGPNFRRTHLNLLNRDQVLEIQERNERDRFEALPNRKSGEEYDDARSVGTNSVTASGSVLGRLDHDAVSIHDAVDTHEDALQQSIELLELKPNGPWWSRSRLADAYGLVLNIAEWDHESKRICKLGFPFMAESLFLGIAEAVRVALIGKLVGTKALSAYIIVDLLVGLTTQMMQGFQDALTSLCSQALGAGNETLAGQYVQMTVIVYTLLYIPVFIFWYFFIVDAMLWFEFDQKTADMGLDFAVLLLLAELIGGLDRSVHALLDVIGCENYSTIFAIVTQVSVTVGTFIVAQRSDVTLQDIGYVFVAVKGVALVLNVVIVLWNGWLDPYLEGMIGSLSLRVRCFSMKI